MTTQAELAYAFRIGATAGTGSGMYIEGDALISTLVGGKKWQQHTGSKVLGLRGDFGAGVKWLWNADVSHQQAKQQTHVFDGVTRSAGAEHCTLGFHILTKVLPNWREDGIELAERYEHKPLLHGDESTTKRRLVWARDRSKCWLTTWEAGKWLELDAADLVLLKLTPENNPEWARERCYRKRAEFARLHDIPTDTLDKVPLGEQAMAIRIEGGPWVITTVHAATNLAAVARTKAKRDIKVELFHLDRMMEMYPSWSTTCFFREEQVHVEKDAALEAATEHVVSACG